MTQAIMVHIPDTLYNQLKRTAELSHRSIDTIIAQSLAHSIPPLLEDIPLEYQSDVYPLLEMGEKELQAEAQRVFSPNRWSEYEALLEKNQAGDLTVKEKTRLDILRRDADILMLRKGYAVVLLKLRGYEAPSLRELPKVSYSEPGSL